MLIKQNNSRRSVIKLIRMGTLLMPFSLIPKPSFYLAFILRIVLSFTPIVLLVIFDLQLSRTLKILLLYLAKAAIPILNNGSITHRYIIPLMPYKMLKKL